MADTRQKLLDAAREELMSPEYDLLAGLVLSRVAKRAGVSLSTAKRHLTVDELQAGLQEDLLRVRPGELGTEHYSELAEIIVDPERPLDSLVVDIVDLVAKHNSDSDLFRSMMAFWALSDDDVHTSINDIYNYRLRGGHNGLSSLLEKYPGDIALRDSWISIADFLRAAIALTEGLAIQQSLEQRDDNGEPVNTASDIRPIDPDLSRKVMLAVFASMIDLDGVASVDEVLEQLHARKQA